MSTTFFWISRARSSTETSILSLIFLLLLLPCGCLTLAGIGQHDIAGYFDQFAVTASNSFQVVLHNALAAFTKIFPKRFLDSLKQRFVADTAFGSERCDSQENAEQ